MKRTRQIVTVLLLAFIILMSAGCYGSFNLTKKVYHWNGSMEGKWVKEVVFLVLTIVPVYEISATVDAVILNSIEFWTGNNPIASTVITKDGATIAFDADKKAVTVSYENKSVTFSKENDKMLAKDAQGNVIAYAIAADDGTMNIMDVHGKILRTFSKDQVELISLVE